MEVLRGTFPQPKPKWRPMKPCFKSIVVCEGILEVSCCFV